MGQFLSSGGGLIMRGITPDPSLRVFGVARLRDRTEDCWQAKTGEYGKLRRISDRLYSDLFPGQAGPAMTFPVIIHASNGQFEATLLGAPEVRATASTREE